MFDEHKAQKELAALKAVRDLAEQTTRAIFNIAEGLADGDATRRVLSHGLNYAAALMDANCPVHGANCPGKKDDH